MGRTWSIFNEISYNNFTNGEDSGIQLSGIENSEIIGNNITGFNIGIECSSTESNKISKNIIFNNKNGIKLSNSEGDHFKKNHIEGNIGYGFSLSRSKEINIEKNNIIDNNPNAKFSSYFPNFFRNKWIGNYWSDGGNIIYKIQGKFIIEIPSFIPYEPPREIIYSWNNYDIRPAKNPIDIDSDENVKPLLTILLKKLDIFPFR